MEVIVRKIFSTLYQDNSQIPYVEQRAVAVTTITLLGAIVGSLIILISVGL